MLSDPLGRVTHVAGGLVEATGEVPRILDRAADFGRLALQNPVGAGEVTVGIACDKNLVPDHEAVVDGFAVAFDRLLAATPRVTH
jgi:hypothetical protein